MPINMRGYNVFYDEHTYTCLQIEPYNRTEIRFGLTFIDAQRLRVTILDDNGRFDILDDFADQFEFFYDSKHAL